jgi:oligoribonuclease NrnB/cAMP/cGMP phosphodiesterase (DHH superfamily)
MAWDWFHSEYVPRAPKLIAAIEDRDLWRWKLEDSVYVHKALLSHPRDFKLWNKFANSGYEALVEEGKTLNRMHEMLVADIVKGSWVIANVSAYLKIAVVNTSIAWSEVGNALLEKHPEADFAAAFTVFNDKTMVSLRSKGDFDVSAIAKRFGGGGHKNAAGFNIPKDQDLEEILEDTLVDVTYDKDQ